MSTNTNTSTGTGTIVGMGMRRGAAVAMMAVLTGLAVLGCAAGAGGQAYTTRGWMSGAKSEEVAAAVEQVLSQAGTVVGRDHEKGEIYATVRGYAVTGKVEPGSTWASFTCRADGTWSQDAAAGTWTVEPGKVSYTAEGFTPEKCAQELLDKIQGKP